MCPRRSAVALLLQHSSAGNASSSLLRSTGGIMLQPNNASSANVFGTASAGGVVGGAGSVSTISTLSFDESLFDKI